MEPEEASLPEPGISRRKMLKRIGAGAAVAWCAPILTSIRSPAFAASGTCSCPPYDCENPQRCENGCPCAPHHGGGPCICFGDAFCAGPNTCNTDADCLQFDEGHFTKGIDINPDCPGCGGNQTACADVEGCTGSGGTRRFKGIRRI